MTPWTAAHQAPLSIGFSRQEYWSGLPCLPSGDLSDPGIELVSLAFQVDSLPLGKPYICMYMYIRTHICTYIYIYRWIYFVCIYNGILAAKKSDILPLVTTWMDLESIKLSLTDRYYISQLYVKSRKETEKAMAPHSSTLAWKIPWMEEPGRLQSMGSLRVRHD